MREVKESQKGYVEGGYQFFFLEDQKKMNFEYHYHSFHKCLIILEGEVKYEVEGINYDLSGGDIIWVPSYEAHKVEVSNRIPYKRIVVYLSKQFVALLSGKLDQAINQMSYKNSYYTRITGKDIEVLQALFPYRHHKSDSVTACVDKTDICFDESLTRINSFIKWMNYYFAIIENQDDEDLMYSKSLKGKEEWIFTTMTYISQHLGDALTIDEVASQVYLSKYYFMRKFKETLGISIHQYIIKQRLIQARYLMKHGVSLTEISYQSGFKDYSTFARAFKKTYKKSPREFQKLNPSTEFE